MDSSYASLENEQHSFRLFSAPFLDPFLDSPLFPLLLSLFLGFQHKLLEAAWNLHRFFWWFVKLESISQYLALDNALNLQNPWIFGPGFVWGEPGS